MTPARFPHSDTPGSTLGCQLPRAYRRLLRPSSALDAKASTMCPSQLVTHHQPPPPTHRRTEAAGDAHNTPQKNHTPAPTITGPGAQKTKRNTPTPPEPTGPGAQVHLQMLASTIQISNNNPTPDTDAQRRRLPSRVVLKPSLPSRVGLIPQNPNSVSPMKQHGLSTYLNSTRATTRTRPTQRRQAVVNCLFVLLRKEGIQPHLPVRLPCYDFVPIASPTFDHSLQQAGWAVGFGCCRLS